MDINDSIHFLEKISYIPKLQSSSLPNKKNLKKKEKKVEDLSAKNFMQTDYLLSSSV